MGANTRPSYPAAVRAGAVALVRGGRSLTRAAKDLDLGMHHETPRGWVRQADTDGRRRDGLTTDERAELARLRRKGRVLREERELLRTAAGCYAAGRTQAGRPVWPG